MAHARRKYFDVHTTLKSPLAAEALDRIGKLYQIEREIHGCSPEERLAARQARAVPVLNELYAWMLEKASQVDPKSPLMEALKYSLNRWESLCRYAQDGRLSIDNNSAERSIRGVGIGRKNYMFFGSDNGGDRAAVLYSLVETRLCRVRHRHVWTKPLRGSREFDPSLRLLMHGEFLRLGHR